MPLFTYIFATQKFINYESVWTISRVYNGEDNIQAIMKNTLLYTNPHIAASGCWVHPEMSIANNVIPGVHPLS